MAKQGAVRDRDLIYQLDGRPSLKVAIPIGFQHILAMFTGNLAPIMIVAMNAGLEPNQRVTMMQAAMVVSALTTFIQLYPLKMGPIQIGSRLPIVMGTSFAFVPVMSTIAKDYGIGGVIGACILGSFVEIIIGVFYKQLKVFFSPLLIGSVLVAVGISLLSVGATYFGGGAGAGADFASTQNLTLGFVTFGITIVLQRFGKGMYKATAILIGLTSGYLLAILMGAVDFTNVTSSAWVSLPTPFAITPQFQLTSFISIAAIYIVSGLETMGNTSGITIGAFNREAKTEETSGAILADACGSLCAAVFGALPNTAFGQNAGLVSLTKIVNRFCIACGACVLLLAGLVPKIGAIFNAMPASVLGGAVIAVFAMITINGIKMIAKAGFSEKNLLVLAIIFGLGYGGSLTQTINVDGVPTAFKLMEHVPVLKYMFHDSTSAVVSVGIIAELIFGERKTNKDKSQPTEVAVPATSTDSV